MMAEVWTRPSPLSIYNRSQSATSRLWGAQQKRMTPCNITCQHMQKKFLPLQCIGRMWYLTNSISFCIFPAFESFLKSTFTTFIHFYSCSPIFIKEVGIVMDFISYNTTFHLKSPLNICGIWLKFHIFFNWLKDVVVLIINILLGKVEFGIWLSNTTEKFHSPQKNVFAIIPPFSFVSSPFGCILWWQWKSNSKAWKTKFVCHLLYRESSSIASR